MALDVCPSWLSFTLQNRFRRKFHNPDQILSSYIKNGDIAADIGCGPGFFTGAIARLVGDQGRVIAADLQPAMLDRTRKVLEREGMIERARFHKCEADRLTLPEPVDFALTFWMVHEVPDPGSFFAQIAAALKPGGRVLFVEPKMHVMKSMFEKEIKLAEKAGLDAGEKPEISLSRAVLMVKPS